MTKISKMYNVAISKKFPDGSLVSLHFGTNIEKETDDARALFEEVKKSTMKDIEASKTDIIAKSVLTSLSSVLKQEKRFEEACNGNKD